MRFVATTLAFIMFFLTSCESRAVSGAGIIAMEVGNLNPVEVGILTPSKKFIFTHSDEFICRGTMVGDGHLSIDPSDAVGYYWDSKGERLEVAVFREVGDYTIYVSDNLETEAENSSAITKKYTAKRSLKTVVNVGDCKPVRSK